MELFKIFGTIALSGQENFNNQLTDATKKGESAGDKISKAFRKIGTAVATYFSVTAIKNFGQACITAAADAAAMSSQFTQVFGDFEGAAAASLSQIANAAGINENRMKGSFTKIAAFAKTTGMDTATALALSERAMIAVADSAAFYDRSLEDTTESLQSFLKGNFENDAALGLSCTETTRNAAANKLYGKSFKDLSEEQKQLTLLQMVEDANALSGALGQAARESETWTNVTGNLRQSFTDFQATVGKYVLPTVTKLVGKLSDFVTSATKKVDPAVAWLTKKFQALKTKLLDVGSYVSNLFQPTLENLASVFEWVKNGIQPFIDKLVSYVTSGQAAETVTNFLRDALNFVAEAAAWVTEKLVAFTNWCSTHQDTIKTIAIIVGSFAAAWVLVNGAIKVWTTIGLVAAAVTTAFGAAVAFLTSPITLTVLAIGALIAAGILLYQNWDTIKAKAAELWEAVTLKFTEIKDGVVAKIEELKAGAVAKFEEIKNDIVNKVDLIKTNVVTKFDTIKANALSKWEELKTGITEKIEAARDTVGQVIETIKGFFNFEWSLPALKLPHVSISGEFSLSPPSVPQFSISWYKKAMNNPMLLDEPTIFGYDSKTGNFLGGGEAGPEVVSGASSLMGMISTAVSSQNDRVVEVLTAILAALTNGNGSGQDINISTTLELDGSVLARKLYRHNQTVTNDRGLAFVRG